MQRNSFQHSYQLWVDSQWWETRIRHPYEQLATRLPWHSVITIKSPPYCVTEAIPRVNLKRGIGGGHPLSTVHWGPLQYHFSGSERWDGYGRTGKWRNRLGIDRPITSQHASYGETATLPHVYIRAVTVHESCSSLCSIVNQLSSSTA